MAASSSLCEGLRAKAPLDKPKIIPFDEEKAPWRSAVAVILRISATGQTEVGFCLAFGSAIPSPAHLAQFTDPVADALNPHRC